MTESLRDARPASLPQTGARLSLVGVAGLVLGLAGLVMVFAQPAIELVWYAGLLIALGLAHLVEVLHHRGLAGRTIRGLLALVYISTGVALMVAPAEIGDIELLVTALFIVAGSFRVAWSMAWPRWPKAWGIGAGFAAVAFGLLLLLSWPRAALWMLGAAVASDLALYGAGAVLLGWALRQDSAAGASSISPST